GALAAPAGPAGPVGLVGLAAARSGRRVNRWQVPRSVAGMDITIVGGGIAGLAVAHELAPDHDVTVLESSSGPLGGGYMIDFFGPGFVAAERMGIIGELRSRGHEFEGVRYGLPDGSQTGTIDVAPLVEAVGGRYFSILRPEVE